MVFTCLLIDDDPDDLEIFSLALEDVQVACSCITARNGVDALNILNANQSLVPHFIFIDLNMPFLNGKRCLEEIKKINRLVDVPAIIYTTSSLEEDVQDTYSLGATHYIIKPSSINALSTILGKIFRHQPLPFLLHERSESLYI
jgi:CheY-like chemotaxis protein